MGQLWVISEIMNAKFLAQSRCSINTFFGLSLSKSPHISFSGACSHLGGSSEPPTEESRLWSQTPALVKSFAVTGCVNLHNWASVPSLSHFVKPLWIANRKLHANNLAAQCLVPIHASHYWQYYYRIRTFQTTDDYENLPEAGAPCSRPAPALCTQVSCQACWTDTSLL